MSKTTKRIITIVLAVVLAVGALTGILYALKMNRDPINVYAVRDVSMETYWGDSTESYGSVRADRMQDVYVSDTQKITEIFVTEGQTVKEGDKLLSYDSTLTEIALTRKQIAVQKLELQLKQAKADLAEINTYRPYTPPVPKPAPEPDPGEQVEVPYLKGGNGTAENPYIWLWDDTCVFTQDFILQVLGTADQAYAVFQQRADNTTKGELLQSWAFVFSVSEEGKLSFTMFDYTEPEEPSEPEEPDTPVDPGPQYTAAEIAQMKAEKNQQIKDLDLQYRMAEIEYKQQKAEFDDGTVYAKYDGTVTTVLDEETARADGSAIIRVAGGGGYYVTGTVSELELDSVQIGQSVTVNSWESGGVFEGTITEIADYPTSSGYYSGMGNTNVSYYPFTVQIDGDAALREGEGVSITYEAQQLETGGFYMQSPFILSEGGKNFAYVRGEDGRLEKREVVTGKRADYYWQILGGLTMDDFVAFPYSKEAQAGAKTTEAALDALYGY
jgi:HlyD family secretion protein